MFIQEINLDGYKSIGTNWIALYVNDVNVTYFDSFGVEYIVKEIKKFIGHKNIAKNDYRIPACCSIMCGHFCIGFIDFMITIKSKIYYLLMNMEGTVR